jgi:hypothetical protein
MVKRGRLGGMSEMPIGMPSGIKRKLCVCEELDGRAVSALRRAIAEGKQRWSVIGWVTKNLLS